MTGQPECPMRNVSSVVSQAAFQWKQWHDTWATQTKIKVINETNLLFMATSHHLDIYHSLLVPSQPSNYPRAQLCQKYVEHDIWIRKRWGLYTLLFDVECNIRVHYISHTVRGTECLLKRLIRIIHRLDFVSGDEHLLSWWYLATVWTSSNKNPSSRKKSC